MSDICHILFGIQESVKPIPPTFSQDNGAIAIVV